VGRKIHIDAVRAFARETPVFRSRDVGVVVGRQGYADLLLHNMANRGEIHRLMRGWYSSHDDPVLSVFCFKPAYLGLQEALSMRNLWEQETNVVVLTPAKVREGLRSVAGSNVVVRRLPVHHFFGYDFIPYGEWRVPVSDPEKTLIDLVSLGEVAHPDILSELLGAVDVKKLQGYLAAYPRRTRDLVMELL